MVNEKMVVQETELKRTIGFWVALTLVIGTIIGSGVFIKPASVLGYAGNSSLALWAWLFGGIMTLAAGLTIAEIGAQIPKTGGLFTYMEELYGRMWGFLSGWMQTLIYGPAIVATLGLFFGALVANFFQLDQGLVIWIGVASVVFLTVVNMIGTAYGGFVQVITTISKLLPVAFIIVFGIIQGDASVSNVVVPQTEGGNFGVAVLATLFAYDGWILLANMSGEIKNPQKNLPRAMIIGLLVVTFAYCFVNFAIMKVIPAETLVGLGDTSSAEAARILFGDIGGKLINLGVIISIFGCLNGKIMTFPRVPYAMAERNMLPFSRHFRYVHPTLNTPIGSLGLVLVLSLIMMAFFDAEFLSEICIFVIYCFYIFTFYGLFKLRRQNKERSYSVPLFPIVPIIAIGGGLFVIVSKMISTPDEAFYSLLCVALGLPVYYLLRHKMD